ncbi:MAG TPA: beta-N-acetylhexosaminidase, partial [Fimbriimonadaceae bacterium]|nr:beta-N-acetylhexosaminidase [Fimbriimonadaceae bacterium]
MALLFVAALLAMSTQTDSISIIPKPARLEARPGSFRLDPSTSICAGDGLSQLAHYLQHELSPATGFYFPVSEREGKDSIELKIDSRAARLGPEGYVLEVGNDRIVIRSEAQAGLFYGCQSLLQMLPADIFRKATVARERGWHVPCALVEDSPRFPWRGAMLDVSRHFMPKEFVLKFIDLIA